MLFFTYALPIAVTSLDPFLQREKIPYGAREWVVPDFTKGGKLESDCSCFQPSSCLSSFLVTQILSFSGMMPGRSSCFSCISPSANSLTSPSSSFPFHILTSLNFIENRCGSYSPCPIGHSFERKGSRDILTPATQCPEPLMSCSLILDMSLVSGHV